VRERERERETGSMQRCRVGRPAGITLSSGRGTPWALAETVDMLCCGDQPVIKPRPQHMNCN